MLLGLAGRAGAPQRALEGAAGGAGGEEVLSSEDADGLPVLGEGVDGAGDGASSREIHRSVEHGFVDKGVVALDVPVLDFVLPPAVILLAGRRGFLEPVAGGEFGGKVGGNGGLGAEEGRGGVK